MLILKNLYLMKNYFINNFFQRFKVNKTISKLVRWKMNNNCEKKSVFIIIYKINGYFVLDICVYLIFLLNNS
jgi:hypothetical protein